MENQGSSAKSDFQQPRPYADDKKPNDRTAYIFPGQGSQYVGMGKELYESYDDARKLFEEANKILKKDFAIPSITNIMFSGKNEELRKTEIAQPAIFLNSVISAMSRPKHIPEPCVVAGHSLGEYSALVVSGAMDFEGALRLVCRRAKIMQKACESSEGTMVAIMNVPETTITNNILAKVVEKTLTITNYNSDSEFVISGPNNAIEEATKIMDNEHIRYERLQVSGAFHSPLMFSATKEFEDFIAVSVINQPKYPIYQNVTGTKVSDIEEIKKNLKRQLYKPVLWSETIRQMVEVDKVNSFAIFGAKKPLENFLNDLHPNGEFGIKPIYCFDN